MSMVINGFLIGLSARLLLDFARFLYWLRFEQELADWLYSPSGKFQQYLAERDRG